MPEAVLVLAVVLLVAAVLGSVLPLLPSGLLALAGVYVYVFLGAEPVGYLFLASATLAGVTAVLFEQFGGPLAARAAGASSETTYAAVVAGLLGFLVLGPVGVVVGAVAAVFLLELRGGASPKEAGGRSVATALGVLASTGVQLALTLAILVGFVVFVAL